MTVRCRGQRSEGGHAELALENRLLKKSVIADGDISGTGRRMRKVMVVALARKLLIALWRFGAQGVVLEGAVMKPAS